MNASEARKTASRIKEEPSKRDYNKVLQEIIEAVNSGKFSVEVSDSLLRSSINKLEEDGYTIRHVQSDINEYSYEISW